MGQRTPVGARASTSVLLEGSLANRLPQLHTRHLGPERYHSATDGPLWAYADVKQPFNSR